MAGAFASASSQYLDSATAPVSDYPITMACWANCDSDSFNETLMHLYSNEWGDYSGLLLEKINGGTIRAASTNFAAASSDTGNITGGVWFHACGVWASSTSRIVYLNGSAGTEDTTSKSFSVNSLYIGRRNAASPDRYVNGKLAEAAVWSAALTAPEVASLAKGYAPSMVRPGSLAFYLPMVRGLVGDVVGGLQMTNNNTVTVAAHPRVIYPRRKQVVVASAAAPAGVFAPYFYREHIARAG